MKKRISLFLAVLAINSIVCIPVLAQEEQTVDEPRHEISLAYGVVPNSVWIDVLTDVVPALFGETHENNHYYGPVSLEYYYHTSPLIGVGGNVVFVTNNNDGYLKDNQLNSHHHKSYFTVMPSVKFNWLRRNKWGMYSKVAIGGTLTTFTNQDYDDHGKRVNEKETTRDLIFNFQASLLGVEVGGRQVRGFAELGVGEQGMVLGGVRYKF